MRYLLLPILLLFYISSLAQSPVVQYWEPTVYDKSTKQFLEVASISINKKTDFPLNEKGTAKIPFELLKKGDTVFVSCLGYKTEAIAVKGIDELTKIIELLPAIYKLNQVNITKGSYKPKEVTVGTKAFSISQSYTSTDSKYALFINNVERSRGYIKTVSIRMKDGAGGRTSPFKLQLYARGREGRFPEKELMDAIIVQNIKNMEWFEVDLAYLGIEIPEDGFFISVETLDDRYYSGRQKKIHGRYVRPLPGIAFTTFPKSINKDNYSVNKFKNSKWFITQTDIEYQMRAKLLLANE